MEHSINDLGPGSLRNIKTAKQTISGNQVTAVRWARILRDLGHRVRIEETQNFHNADLLIAIHAFRSAQAIDEWTNTYADRPLVMLLAGTDIYRFQYSHADITLAAKRRAHRLVGLHDYVADDIPAQFSSKLRVIHQSALPLARRRSPNTRTFDICVIGHLRYEKDPLRAARAAAQLPPTSKIRIVQLGKAHSEDYARAAAGKMTVNPRYQWRGDVSRGAVRRALGRCQAIVMSSLDRRWRECGV